MQLVERHLESRDHPQYASIDAAAFASKNLYHQANDQIRQAFIHEGTYLPSAEIFHRVKGMDCYQALPAKVANSILIRYGRRGDHSPRLRFRTGHATFTAS